MANCTISSASLIQPNKDNVFTTSAVVSYIAAASLPSNSSTSTTEGPSMVDSGSETQGNTTTVWAIYASSTTTITYSYSNLVYNWTFTPSGSANDASGSVVITGLIIGSANAIKGAITVTCTETITTTVVINSYAAWAIYTTDPETGKTELVDSGTTGLDPTSTSTSSSSPSACGTSAETNEIIVYTRPGTFNDYGFAADTIIESSSGLTAIKVSNWIAHCNTHAHWYNQNSTDVTTNNCVATTGNVITATWYNACIDAIAGLSQTDKNNYHVTGGPNGTIITAAIINLLGTLISKDDT